MTNPFSWDYLTAPMSEMAVWGPFSIAFLIIFILGFAVAAFFNWDSHQRLKNNRLLLTTVQRGTWIAIIVFGIGLFFFSLRLLEVRAFGLHWRLWLYVSALVAAAMLVYFWYYIRTIYPRHAAAEEAEQRKREYIERPAHGKSKRPRGKKKKKRA